VSTMIREDNGMQKRRALGRGLGALIPGGEPSERAPARGEPARGDYFLAGIEDVHPSPEQPRQAFDEAKLEELAQSIRSEGIIQPLVVRERGARDGGGFWLIAGERRWRAAQRAGLHQVPVVVREASPAKAFEMALVENVQRADLNPIEEAEAYRRLSEEFGYTQEQLAERVGKDRTTVTNALRLLKLPAGVRKLVSDGDLSMGHARALLGLEGAEAIEIAARKVAARALSVRATEELVRRERDGKSAKPAAPGKSASVRDLEEKLTRALGSRVRIEERGGGKAGRIEIDYADLDDLDRLLDVLLPSKS
jgi:ParB family transcriptional regulator, chromosome partitioning protein